MLSTAPLFLVFCSLLWSEVSAQVDENQIIADVCKDITPTPGLDVGKEFQFEPQFKVHVESVMPDYGRITNSWMEFSTDKKMLLTTLKSPGWDYALYHDYEHHQTLVYNMADNKTTRGSCYVDPEMRDRQGFYLVPSAPEEGTAPKVTDIFRLTGPSGIGGKDIALQKRRRTEKLRSSRAQRYLSCQKMALGNTGDAIVKVEHIVSNTTLTRIEKGTVPVQIIFTGKYVSGTYNGKSRAGSDVKYTYNFFHYGTAVGDDDFMTPGGIICPNRQGPSSFPEPPEHISFGMEGHTSDSYRVITLKTTFDREFNFSTLEFFVPAPGIPNLYRFDDFYFGYTYLTDLKTQTCNMTEITQADTPMDDYVLDKNGHIVMDTPQQFWDTEGIEYHYNGMKHFRGLETEVWIGEDKTGTMYEWYFALGIDSRTNRNAKSEKEKKHRIPYKLIQWSDKNSDQYFSYYFFQVDFTEPDLLLDLSSCYRNNKKHVTLRVAGLNQDIVRKDETTVLRKAVKKLSQELGVYWTRISGPKFVFSGDDGYIVFDLLPAPKQAKDVEVRNEPSLEEAYQTLQQKIKDERLAFEVGNPEEYVEGLAFNEEPKLGAPTRPGGGGYSGGAMAGLCFVMALVGLASGGGGGYWFFFKR